MSPTVYPWVIGSFTPAQPGGLKPLDADNIGQKHNLGTHLGRLSQPPHSPGWSRRGITETAAPRPT